MGRTEGYEIVGVKDDTGATVNPATEDTLKKLVGFGIGEFNEIKLTRVTSGNGVGEIETVVYKLSGDVIATLTLTYDASNEIDTITKT